MLNALRSLGMSAQSAPALPRVDGLRDLYHDGVHPRRGEVIMIAGRAGSQKSGFALWWVTQMNLPTLYFSADMSAWQASVRVASSTLGETVDEIEKRWERGGDEKRAVVDALTPLNLQFSYGPITLHGIGEELDAYVELHNKHPEVIVLDNLMDIENAQSDYHLQMEAMQEVSRISRDLGCSVIVLHHASESVGADNLPGIPPPRHAIKNKLGEKPELTLTVGLDPHTSRFNVACVKQRMGKADAAAKSFTTLQAYPQLTRFGVYEGDAA